MYSEGTKANAVSLRGTLPLRSEEAKATRHSCLSPSGAQTAEWTRRAFCKEADFASRLEGQSCDFVTFVLAMSFSYRTTDVPLVPQ